MLEKLKSPASATIPSLFKGITLYNLNSERSVLRTFFETECFLTCILDKILDLRSKPGIIIEIGKNNWDLETYKKSLKKWFLNVLDEKSMNVYFYTLLRYT